MRALAFGNDGAFTHLSLLFSFLCLCFLFSLARAQIQGDAVREALHDNEAKKTFAPGAPAGAALAAAFATYSNFGKSKRQIQRAAAAEEQDRTVTVAALWAMLQDCLVIDSEHPHSSAADVQKVFSRVFFGGSDGGAEGGDIEVTFAQFKEAIVRIASRMYPGHHSLPEKGAKLVMEFIEPNALASL